MQSEMRMNHSHCIVRRDLSRNEQPVRDRRVGLVAGPQSPQNNPLRFRLSRAQSSDECCLVIRRYRRRVAGERSRWGSVDGKMPTVLRAHIRWLANGVANSISKSITALPTALRYRSVIVACKMIEYTINVVHMGTAARTGG
jgi:hypothetical protein